MNQQTTNVIRALPHGLTGAGLSRRLNYPGAPVEFIGAEWRSLRSRFPSPQVKVV